MVLLGGTDVVWGGHHAIRNGACLFSWGFFFPSALWTVHVVFTKLLLILCMFYIMHPDHTLSSCIHHLLLQHPPKIKGKTNKKPKQINKRQRRKNDKNCVVEAAVWSWSQAFIARSH